MRIAAVLLTIGLCLSARADAEPAASTHDAAATVQQAAQWRAEHRIIDMHQHIDFTPEHMARAVKIMDAVGVGIAVNLGTGTVTPGKDGATSAFERNKKLADTLHPGRILHYMLLDYHGWDDEGFAQRAAEQIEAGHRLGAAGLKEFKRFGLFLRDGHNKLLRIDDPKLDLMWDKCGELGMPVSIHVADPKAFWDPFNDKNERWKELKDHRDWWFGDPARYPPRMELLEALDRVIARHPKTTFVCLHFANNAEDLEWVDAALDRRPNMMADLAARIPELGRHDPAAVRKLFIKHQDRILFGTDFMVYNRLILGSSGNEPPPTDDDAATFYAKEWRWLETTDKDWPHMTPIQGDWTISSIGLPAGVLRKIYFDNARKLLARSLPAPVMKAARSEADFEPDADWSNPRWQRAAPVRLEYTLRECSPRPELSTEVRCLWSKEALHILFRCPYTKLTVFEPVSPTERLGLWDRDVVEAFIGTDDANIRRYDEFELAPTNERLDGRIDLPKKDFPWTSGFTSATRVDEKAGAWVGEMRIPIVALTDKPPAPGTRWRLNLFRSDRAGGVFLAWNPALTGSTHTPERFGVLEFAE
jgi:predicted TIM-barrel fold metal-dependent hydrolase